MHTRTAAFTLWAVLYFSSAAVASDTPLRCGTGPETEQRLARLHAWSERQPRERKHAAGAVDLRDGVFIVTGDTGVAPFHRPFDLHGRSLTFVRQPFGGYAVTNTPAVAEGPRGLHLALEGSPEHAPYRLQNFRFSLGDIELQDVVISRFHAIHASVPVESSFWQYDQLELLGQREPLIAPLWTTRASQPYVGEVYVRDTADFVTVTWEGPDWFTDRLVVHATLFRNGDIRFTYERLDFLPLASSVVITSGNDAWRHQMTALATGDDPSGDLDIPDLPTGLHVLADIRRATISRVGGVDLLQFEIKLNAPVDPSILGDDGYAIYGVYSGDKSVQLRMYGDGRIELDAFRPASGNATDTAAAWIEGESVFFLASDAMTAFAQATSIDVSTFIIKANYGYSGDNVRLGINYVAPSRAAMTDFSNVGTGKVLGPVAEAFTRSPLDVYAVWDAVRMSHSLSDPDWDAVAIYPAFGTDIDYYAGGYSTIGVAGVTGVGLDQSTDQARRPALLHLASLPRPATAFGPGQLELHELGHRWLFFTKFVDQSGVSNMLNPGGAHPAQWVDTRAAYPVASAEDASCMGGGRFTDHGGSFTTGNYASYGYSWLDLYFMGLAAPDEVPPWFYIDNSQPPLGIAYWPPSNVHVTGVRKDVTVAQVIAANGPRQPTWPATQRAFRVAFVIVADPDRAVTAQDVAAVRWALERLQRDFRNATGGRGEVIVDIPSRPGRRRAARH